MQEGSLFSTLSPAFIVCRFFDDGHSDWCKVILYCSFDLHFSNDLLWVMLSILSCVCWQFVYLLCRNVCLGLLPIFGLGWLSFWYRAAWAACRFWRLVLFQLLRLFFIVEFWELFNYSNIYGLQKIFPSIWLVFSSFYLDILQSKSYFWQSPIYQQFFRFLKYFLCHVSEAFTKL